MALLRPLLTERRLRPRRSSSDVDERSPRPLLRHRDAAPAARHRQRHRLHLARGRDRRRAGHLLEVAARRAAQGAAAVAAACSSTALAARRRRENLIAGKLEDLTPLLGRLDDREPGLQVMPASRCEMGTQTGGATIHQGTSRRSASKNRSDCSRSAWICMAVRWARSKSVMARSFGPELLARTSCCAARSR